eukprot:3616551-Amphidinium_carterae.1
MMSQLASFGALIGSAYGASYMAKPNSYTSCAQTRNIPLQSYDDNTLSLTLLADAASETSNLLLAPQGLWVSRPGKHNERLTSDSPTKQARSP